MKTTAFKLELFADERRKRLFSSLSFVVRLGLKQTQILIFNRSKREVFSDFIIDHLSAVIYYYNAYRDVYFTLSRTYVLFVSLVYSSTL